MFKSASTVSILIRVNCTGALCSRVLTHQRNGINKDQDGGKKAIRGLDLCDWF